jgi:hypothetical protein
MTAISSMTMDARRLVRRRRVLTVMRALATPGLPARREWVCVKPEDRRAATVYGAHAPVRFFPRPKHAMVWMTIAMAQWTKVWGQAPAALAHASARFKFVSADKPTLALQDHPALRFAAIISTTIAMDKWTKAARREAATRRLIATITTLALAMFVRPESARIL